jgi:hypothetical protein
MADNSSRNQHKKTFGGATCALTAIDVHSHFHWGYLLRSTSEILEPLKDIRDIIKSSGRQLKMIRTDNAFLTKEIKRWCKHRNITLRPCITS